jgi:hypothetical protein
VTRIPPSGPVVAATSVTLSDAVGAVTGLATTWAVTFGVPLPATNTALTVSTRYAVSFGPIVPGSAIVNRPLASSRPRPSTTR